MTIVGNKLVPFKENEDENKRQMRELMEFKRKMADNDNNDDDDDDDNEAAF